MTYAKRRLGGKTRQCILKGRRKKGEKSWKKGKKLRQEADERKAGPVWGQS